MRTEETRVSLTLEMEAMFPPKHRFLQELHDVIVAQKTAFFIVTAAKTSVPIVRLELMFLL
jgi:hypothetical protein